MHPKLQQRPQHLAEGIHVSNMSIEMIKFHPCISGISLYLLNNGTWESSGCICSTTLTSAATILVILSL